MPISKEDWDRIVAQHAALWVQLASNVASLERTRWDALLCMVDVVYGMTVITPAKLNAPFSVPQSPDDKRVPDHYRVFSEHAVELSTPEFDAGSQALYPDDPSREEWDELEAQSVRALSEGLDNSEADIALARLGDPESFTIAWGPPCEPGTYVHLHHLCGAPLGEPEAPTTAYAALAPLLWHANTVVGRSNPHLVFEGDAVVEVTFSGEDVTDKTLALLTLPSVAQCATLRTMRFRDTRITVPAIRHLRELLPSVRIEHE